MENDDYDDDDDDDDDDVMMMMMMMMMIIYLYHAGDQQTAYSTPTCSPVNLAANVSSSRLPSGNNYFYWTEVTRHTLLPSDEKSARTQKRLDMHLYKAR